MGFRSFNSKNSNRFGHFANYLHKTVEFIGAGQNISIPLHKSKAVIAEIINETIFNITRDWFKAEHANGYADLLKRERNYPILKLLKP